MFEKIKTMFKIKNIYIKNFLSFVGEHQVNFPDSGLISLKGCCDNNSSLSNGAGKSSLLEAIAYIFDYCSSPATELQSWFSDVDFIVSAELINENESLKVTRGPGVYEVFCNDVLYKSNHAKEFMKKLLYSPELIAFMTYRPQGVSGNFLSLNNSDKYQFLSNLLDLSNIENIIENANISFKNIEKNILEKSNLMESYKRENELLEKYKIDLLEKIKSYREKNDILETRKRTISNERRVNYLELFEKEKNKLFLDKETLEKNKQQIYVSFNEKKIEKANQYIRKINLIKSDMQNTQNEFDFVNEEILESLTKDIEEKQLSLSNNLTSLKSAEDKIVVKEKLINQLKALLSNTCFVCNQSWLSDGVLIKKIQDDLFDINMTEKKMPYMIEIVQKIKNEITILQKEQENLLNVFKVKKTNEECVQKINFYEKQCEIELNKLELEYTQELNNVNLLINNLNNDISNLSTNIQNKERYDTQKLNNDLQNIDESIVKNNEVIQDLKNQFSLLDSRIKKDELNEINESISKYNFDKNIELEILNCLGKENFFSLIFQELMYSISCFANKMLSNIPNANLFHIEFENDKLTQKGNLKRGINLKIFQKGFERPFKMLSGGEKCAINLAIDTAISQIISHRMGKSFGWMVFDEPFDAMDAFSKMESIEVLKQIAVNKLIIIVEHTNDLNEMFDKNILINKCNGKSKIVTNF